MATATVSRPKAPIASVTLVLTENEAQYVLDKLGSGNQATWERDNYKPRRPLGTSTVYTELKRALEAQVPLAPDDPARDKILALRESKATNDDIMDAMDTYSVDASYLVKALSPGHAKLMVAELLEHMIELHLAQGTFALSGVVVKEEPITWLDGPLFGGPMQDA